MSLYAASFVFKKTLFRAAVLLIAGTLGLSAEPIRYSGSDFLRGDAENALNAAIEKAFGEAPQSKLRGSISGEKELRGEEADFSLLILPSGGKNLKEVKDGSWKVFPLAYQVAYIAVAAANPAEKITFGQLASIFGNFSRKAATSWAEAGVPGFSASLTPCVGDLTRTNSVMFFQRKVLPNFSLRPSVRTIIADADVFKEIVNNPGTIAVVGSPVPAGVPVKTLAVADDTEDANATEYAPTFSNIYNEDYPLTIPLYLVYPTKNRQTLKPVLSYLYSDEMAEKLTQAGFLALEPKLREQFQKGIDKIQ